MEGDGGKEAIEARRQWRRGGNGGEEVMEVKRQQKQGDEAIEVRRQ
jgi:hypothetical protein